MGTPYYMAPERARGSRVVEPTSDIFSLGAILYESLTGVMAFAAETSMAAMYKVIRDPVPPLHLPDTALSQRLDAVIAKACAKDPHLRYQSASEMWNALQGAVRGKEQAPSEDLDTGGARLPSTRPPPDLPSHSMAPSSPSRASVSSDVPGSERPTVKAGLAHALFEFVRYRFGEQGLQKVFAAFGLSRAHEILTDLPTAKIEMAELNRLHSVVIQLFDDGSLEVMRDLGAHFSEWVLKTVYKSFLTPAGPETIVRRAQIMYGAMTETGEARVEKVGERQWCMHILNLPTLTPPMLAATGGWVRRYLQMAGARDIGVEDRFRMEGGQPVGDVYFSFTSDEA